MTPNLLVIIVLEDVWNAISYMSGYTVVQVWYSTKLKL